MPSQAPAGAANGQIGARAALGGGRNERVCTVSDSALAPQDRGGARRGCTQREGLSARQSSPFWRHSDEKSLRWALYWTLQWHSHRHLRLPNLRRVSIGRWCRQSVVSDTQPHPDAVAKTGTTSRRRSTVTGLNACKDTADSGSFAEYATRSCSQWLQSRSAFHRNSQSKEEWHCASVKHRSSGCT